MLKKSLSLMVLVLICAFDSHATLTGQIGTVKTLLTSSIIPVGVLGASSIAFFVSMFKGNTGQAFSSIGIGIMFAFFYHWVMEGGFVIGVSG